MQAAETDWAHVPFAASLKPAFFFRGAGRGEVLDSLFEAVDSGAPVCLITGEMGSGKSAIAAELDRRLEHVAHVLYLTHPQLPMIDLFRSLAEQCKLEVSAVDNDDVVEAAVAGCLQNRRALGGRTVLVVEEAQRAASLGTLQRLCYNDGQDPWLQLLVFADSDMGTTEQLQRMLTPASFHIALQDLTPEDVETYCNQHLDLAGRENVESEFAEDLHRLAKGSFRRVNLLASAALAQADESGDLQVSSSHLKQVAHEFGLAAIGQFEVLPCLQKAASAIADRTARIHSLAMSLPRGMHRGRSILAAGAVLGLAMAVTLLLQEPSTPMVDAPTDKLAQHETVPNQALAVPEARVIMGNDRVLSSQADIEPVLPDTVVEPRGIDLAHADPVVPTGRALGDPRLAPLGGAIAKLASQVSSAGDGPFALRSAESEHAHFALIRGVDAAALRIAMQRDTALENPARSLDRWFERSNQWLFSSLAERYSIQLLLVSRDTQKLVDFLARLPASIDRNAMRAFPTERDGSELTLVVFGSYPDASSARRAIDALPRELRRLQPFVRSLGSLRSVVAI